MSDTTIYPQPSSPSLVIDRIAKENYTGGKAQPNADDPKQKLKDSPTKNPIDPSTLRK